MSKDAKKHRRNRAIYIKKKRCIYIYIYTKGNQAPGSWLCLNCRHGETGLLLRIDVIYIYMGQGVRYGILSFEQVFKTFLFTINLKSHEPDMFLQHP